MVVEFHDGTRVKVVKVLPKEPAYADTFGRVGTIKGEPWDEDGIKWCFVDLNDGGLPYYFKLDELAPYNVTVIEGELTHYLDLNNYHLPRVEDINLLAVLRPFDGKRIKLRIEEVS